MILFSARHNANLWKFPNILTMKLEFPIRFTMLASGCLLTVAIVLYLTGIRIPGWNVDRGADRVVKNGESRPTVQVANTPNGRRQGNELMLESAGRLFGSLPLAASARLSVNLFDQQIVAEGRYIQAGQGSKRARLEFDFGDLHHPKTILQICNGRFYYRFERLDAKPALQLADLSKVSDADRHLLIANPATWMATGGLSSLLESLANNFDLTTAGESMIAGTPVIIIRGHWKQDRIRRLLVGQVDDLFIGEQLRWDKLPEHLPHSVEVTLGNDDYFPLFPYRISFFRERKLDRGNEQVKIVTMELYKLTRHVDLPDELFQVESGLAPTDLTRELVDRIRTLNHEVRSAGLITGSSPKR